MSQSTKQPMTFEQWAGVVFALLVVVPAALMPKFGAMAKLLELRYSSWILVPILGGGAAGWLMRRRLDLMIFGAVAAYCGFWCAATWGSRSSATSVYEALAATGVGILPVFLVYAFYRRLFRPRQASHSTVGEGLPFLRIWQLYWKQIIFLGGAFLIMTVMTVSDLNALETGEVESVRLWAPIVSFYERFGYWPAVLLPPVLGIVCGGVLCFKLMKHGRIQP